MHSSTYTLTFGDQAENHVGMQKIGSLAGSGFSHSDLISAMQTARAKGLACELIDLRVEGVPENPTLDAHVLIVRNGVSMFGTDAGSLFEEQRELQYDTKAKMRGRVKNKRARHNICFSKTSQEPEYEQGRGRIVAFSQVPLLNRVRTGLENWLGQKARGLVAEGNLYFDVRKCGIGYHGDSERRRVVGIRLGHTLPLVFRWYNGWKRVGDPVRMELHHGDVYVMSEKAVGTDWKRSSIYTLRHAAGAPSFVA